MNERKVQVNFVVTESELKQIKKNASACDKTLSAYVREVALNMQTIPFDHSIVTLHSNEISAYRNAINTLVYTIKRTGTYTPADLEYILTKTKEILKSEKTFLQNYISFIEETKKLIVKTVRNIVQNHLSPKTKGTQDQ